MPPERVPDVLAAVATAFGLVFLAELGDKTQLVVLTMGGGRRPGPTLAGLAVVIAVLQGVAVGAGALVARTVPDPWLGVGSGLLFLGFAAWAWLAGDDHDDADRPPGSLGGFLAAFLVAELGDKSNLATALLATNNDVFGTWVGATGGFFAATVVSLVAGAWLRRRVASATMQRAGAVAFAVVGVVTLVAALVNRAG